MIGLGVVLLLLVAPVALVLGVIQALRSRKAEPLKKRERLRNAGIAIVTAFAAMVGGGALIGADPSAQAPTPGVAGATPAPHQAALPPSIAAASAHIHEVQENGPQLRLRTHLDPDERSDGGYVQAATEVIEKVGKQVKAGVREDNPSRKVVSVAFYTEGMDRLGKAGELLLFEVDLDASDLRQANYENLMSWQVFDLAASIVPESRVGMEELTAWCADKSHLQAAPHACSPYGGAS